MHLTIRVAWHDNRWNGTVCSAPSHNSFCVALDRIREERDDFAEDQIAEQPWNTLKPDQMPSCIAESGGFMSPQEWTRVINHPYQANRKTESTHGHLQPTPIIIPPFSTSTVPFWWMLKEHQAETDESLPEPLPPDKKAPFPSPWVFGRERQEALSELFFRQVRDEQSLVFFYCKEGTPLGDLFPRLVVAVGTVVKVGPLLHYDSSKSTTYPLWDRIIRHSIRPDGHEGFVLPYHEYLEPTGDPEEDARRLSLLEEIAVEVPPEQMGAFSYVSELAGHGVALSTLVRCLEAVRKIREHGIASGPWERREEWLNHQIAAEWKNRGAFPGLGSALEALGMRLGTALIHELASNGDIQVDENPWPLIDAILSGKTRPPQAAYKADLDAIRRTWECLSGERRQLLELLSRFELTPSQAKRWFDRDARLKATSVQINDTEILANPYRISETDVDGEDDPAVAIGTIDMGLLPDTTISVRHPVPSPSTVGSQLDARRVRAALVSVLRAAANTGDSLLSATEAIEGLQSLDLAQPCNPGTDWLEANINNLAGIIELLRLPVSPESEKIVLALQLTELKKREEGLQKVLRARAERTLESTEADWKPLLIDAIRDSGGDYDEEKTRHILAIEEQASALEKITTRKLSVLVGRAGTGKTSVLGALLHCQSLVAGGILLLAPTGKARVKLGKATGAEAATVAQFLNGLGRYDGARQRPLFAGEKHKKEKTVVIDECSMLTMDDLSAVLEALNLGHVQRIILVGDPNQLPPIGVGRPFADLVASLEESADSNDDGVRNLADALARLTVEVRATAGGPSDTLRLASWFTRDPQPVDADRVLSDLERGIPFNDLEVVFWKTPEELHERLLEQFQKHLGLSGTDDLDGFNRALGFSKDGMIPFDAPEGAENFQILSPVRMHPYGVYDLNRWLQRQFRAAKLQNARQPWGVSLGDEKIVVHDKVIQNRNQWRYAYDGKSQSKVYFANGEIGIIANNKGNYLNVVFAGRPGYRVGYQSRDFPSGSGPLELAYALTVHKAQGSEFRRVFVILPQNCRTLSRELLYTALTRSRDHLILLVEGDTASSLYEFTKPESSVTASRNTNLFRTAIRERQDDVPYAEYLIHRCENGQMVRSKSELVIANMLWQMSIDYMYEDPVEGEQVPGKVRPDFSFVDPAGDLIIWEHLGMLSRDDYRKSWEWKKDWYAKNGFIEGENLFTTQDDEKGGLDSMIVKEVAETIQSLI